MAEKEQCPPFPLSFSPPPLPNSGTAPRPAWLSPSLWDSPFLCNAWHTGAYKHQPTSTRVLWTP